MAYENLLKEEWYNRTKKEYNALLKTLNDEQKQLLDKILYEKREMYKRDCKK